MHSRLRQSVPAELRFWDIRSRVRLYLTQALLHSTDTTYRVSFYKEGVAALLVVQLTIYLYTVLVPDLSDFVRLLLCDLTLFYQIPQHFAWINVVFTVNALYFHVFMHYRPSGTVIDLLRSILNTSTERQPLRSLPLTYRSLKGLSHKIQATTTKHNHEYCTNQQTLFEAVRRKVEKYFMVIDYFVMCEGALMLYFHLRAWLYMVHHWRFFFLTVPGIFSFWCQMTTSLLVDSTLAIFCTIHMLWTIVVYGVTCVTFAQFHQVNTLLKVFLHRSSGFIQRRSAAAELRLLHFTTRHTVLLCQVFRVNHFLGDPISVFIAVNMPINVHFVMGIVLGRFTAETIGIFVNVLAMQYIVIVYFHLVAAQFTTRIHSCSAMLMRLSAIRCFGGVCGLRTQLALAGYAERFYTQKRYGITYGAVDVLVSFESFFKFTLLYGEFILYWYRLIHNS